MKIINFSPSEISLASPNGDNAKGGLKTATLTRYYGNSAQRGPSCTSLKGKKPFFCTTKPKSGYASLGCRISPGMTVQKP